MAALRREPRAAELDQVLADGTAIDHGDTTRVEHGVAFGASLHRSKPNTPSPGYALRSTNPNALSRVPTEELLLELRRRIVAPRDRRRDAWDDFDGGLDPQGDWPHEG